MQGFRRKLNGKHSFRNSNNNNTYSGTSSNRVCCHLNVVQENRGEGDQHHGPEPYLANIWSLPILEQKMRKKPEAEMQFDVKDIH